MLSSIVDLETAIRKLPEEKKILFKRIFNISFFYPKIKILKENEKYIKKRFSDIGTIKNQKIVRIENMLTHESSLLNSVRALRPIQQTKDIINIEKKDDFCEIKKVTPMDTFGRIEGKCCVTAANIAKYDCYHDLIVFKEHNPLIFSYKTLYEAFCIAFKWFKKINKTDSEARYPLLIWNCLWRAGASVIHAHLQILMAKYRAYPKISTLYKVFSDYKKKYNRDYFEDLYNIHSFLELAFSHRNIHILSHIVPVKEKEIILISKKFSSQFVKVIYRTLVCLRDRLDVKSFNLVFIMQPFNKKNTALQGFPFIVRIIDRGNLQYRSCDIGAMELYAGASVVASDPIKIAYILKNEFKK